MFQMYINKMLAFIGLQKFLDAKFTNSEVCITDIGRVNFIDNIK